MRNMRGWLVPAILIGSAYCAHANSDRALVEGAAGAIVAFEQTGEECFSEPVIKEAFTKLDTYFQNSLPRYWATFKRQAESNNRLMLQMGLAGPEGKNLDAENACKVAARLMMLGIVPLSVNLFAAYPTLEALLKTHADNASGSFLQQNPLPSTGGMDMKQLLDEGTKQTCFIGQESPACDALRRKR